MFGVAAEAQNHAPNPYETIDGWAKLPGGRAWGSTSAVYPTPDGKYIWVAERCGANSCDGKDDLDTVFKFDPKTGECLKAFGAGLFSWPHGIHVDSDGNVWVTDARCVPSDPETRGSRCLAPEKGGKGHQIHKFSPEGELLMSLGTKAVAGQGKYIFDGPSDVLVAPNGDIFVVDGHGAGGNNRVVKYKSDGTYIMEWGTTGKEDGEFRDPHALAMDSEGRLFVGDRGNARTQIFDQEGKHIATWTSFGRPSGLYIKDDILYSADSESNATWGANQGWKRGIRIGSAKTGFITAFIPDPEPDPDNAGTTAAEGVAVDADGNIYGAEVGPKSLKKYVQK
jgi:DNA-binding beta-propeller fold protein YncE